MHNRPAYLMGKRDPLALWSPRVLFFQTAVSLSAAIWSGEYTPGAYVCRPLVQYRSTLVSVRRGFGYAQLSLRSTSYAPKLTIWRSELPVIRRLGKPLSTSNKRRPQIQPLSVTKRGRGFDCRCARHPRKPTPAFRRFVIRNCENHTPRSLIHQSIGRLPGKPLSPATF